MKINYALNLTLLYEETNDTYIYQIYKKGAKYEEYIMLSDLDCFVENKILKINNIKTYKEKAFEYGFKDAHLGSNILSDALTDIWFRKNIKFEVITGDLSYPDANNKNWIDSIPFYRDFPKYLNSNLPFNLKFTLFKPDGEKTREIIKDNVSPKEIVALYGDKILKFRYDLIPK